MDYLPKKITPIYTYDNTWGTLTKYLVDYDKDKVVREVYDSKGDGAAALLYNTDQQAVVFVRQWRITAQLKNINNGWLLEAPAGLLDDQAPVVAMQRELAEETGYHCADLREVATVFASPGAHLEQVYLYVGLVTDEDRKASGGGLASEHEELEVVHIPLRDLDQMLRDGLIIDAKTVILVQYLLLQRSDPSKRGDL